MFAGPMCKDPISSSPNALCIGRPLRIEAEGDVAVLDGGDTMRVLYVSGGGRAELVGLKITGGYVDNHDVSAPEKLPPAAVGTRRL